MMKKTVSALFMGLLLFSTFAATMNANHVLPPLPKDVEPYLVTVDRTCMWEPYWAENDSYRQIDVMKITVGSLELINVTASVCCKWKLTVKWMNATGLTLYATQMRIQVYPEVPEELAPFNPDDVATLSDQQQLHDLVELIIEEDGFLPYLELDVIALEMSNVNICGFISYVVPGSDEVTVKSASTTMSGWDVERAKYDTTKVTKITAGKLSSKDQIYSFTNVTEDYIYTYMIEIPTADMKKKKVENVEFYATYVKAKALGFLRVKWSGDSIPFIVRLGKRFFKTITLTDVTMHVVFVSADIMAFSRMTIDISATPEKQKQ